MPPKENNEGATDASNIPPKKPEVDLDKILLPKKETPGATTQSAERVNAAALLAQETNAELPVQKAAPLPTPPKQDETVVQPLQTYKSDIEKVVKQKNVSVVSMAAAEAEKRAETPLPQAPLPQTVSTAAGMWKKIGFIAGGVLLLSTAAALFAYVLFKPAPQTQVTQGPQPLFIALDDVSEVAIEPLDRETLVSSLSAVRDTFTLSLGLMAQLRPTVASSTGGARDLSIRELLTILAPDMPQELLRTLDPRYVLAIHSYDGNQPFLIIRSDSYEGSYAGMLLWEKTIRSDLSPLFTRTAPIRAPIQTTSTTTAPTIIESDFVDRILENHDTRVIENEYGDILFLWTFLDRRHILIATNDSTLREVVRRLSESPTLSQ